MAAAGLPHALPCPPRSPLRSAIGVVGVREIEGEDEVAPPLAAACLSATALPRRRLHPTFACVLPPPANLRVRAAICVSATPPSALTAPAHSPSQRRRVHHAQEKEEREEESCRHAREEKGKSMTGGAYFFNK